MTTLPATSGAYTLADWAAASRMDDDGKMLLMVNLLSQTNEILDDMMWVEGTSATGLQTTAITSLPTPSYRQFNQGTPLTKDTEATISEAVASLEDESQVDKALADLNGNTAAFRLNRAKTHLQGMGQKVASDIFYSNALLTPGQPHGLSPRYNTLTASTSNTADNVIDCGGSSTDNASMWILTWSEETITGFFPKGQRAGLEHVDKSAYTNGAGLRVFDSNSLPYYAYVDHFTWKWGMAVRDWRYACRLANIDVSDLQTVNAANLINGLIRGVQRLPTQPSGAGPVQKSDDPFNQVPTARTAIYCNRVIHTYLDLQAVNKTNVLLKWEEWAGKPVLTFRGIPVRTVDALVNNETRVVA